MLRTLQAIPQTVAVKDFTSRWVLAYALICLRDRAETSSKRQSKRGMNIGVVNGILIRDKAFLWTDGAQESDGILTAIAPNCIDFPNASVTLVAPSITGTLLSCYNALGQVATSIDSLALEAGGFIDRYMAVMPSSDNLTDEPFWLVGWSEQQQTAMFLECDLRSRPGTRVRPVRSVVSQPISEEDRAALETIVASAPSPDQINTNLFGITLLEAQRRTLAPPNSTGLRRYRVGGYIMQTEISRSGIRHDIIHHWSDQLGVMINPFGDFGSP